MASFLSPTTAQGQATTWWIEELEERTDGRVTVDPFWDASLLGAEEIRDGVRDGRVELGNLTYAYTPSDFPNKRGSFIFSRLLAKGAHSQ